VRVSPSRSIGWESRETKGREKVKKNARECKKARKLRTWKFHVENVPEDVALQRRHAGSRLKLDRR